MSVLAIPFSFQVTVYFSFHHGINQSEHAELGIGILSSRQRIFYLHASEGSYLINSNETAREESRTGSEIGNANSSIKNICVLLEQQK